MKKVLWQGYVDTLRMNGLTEAIVNLGDTLSDAPWVPIVLATGERAIIEMEPHLHEWIVTISFERPDPVEPPKAPDVHIANYEAEGKKEGT